MPDDFTLFDLPVEPVVAPPALQALVDNVARREAQVRKARARLDHLLAERNAAVLRLRDEGASFGLIAKTLGVTRPAAFQIVRKAEGGEP